MIPINFVLYFWLSITNCIVGSIIIRVHGFEEMPFDDLLALEVEDSSWDAS